MTTGLIDECGGTIKVLALTGIRSEYDLLYPLLVALREDPAFELGVIACGAHPTALHNYSLRHIQEDGMPVVEVIDNLLYADSFASKAKTAGLLMTGLAQTLDREQPDLLMTLGDREEVVVGGLTGSYMGIPVVHLAGGDHTHPVGGDVDEEVRHAATKLSHVHLTMAEEHSERVIRLGEDPSLVFTVGSGGIDRLRTNPGLPRDALAASLGDDVLGDYLLVIHHTVSSTADVAADEMRLVLEECLATGLPVFVGAPNSDPGHQSIVEAIREFESHPRLHTYRNLPRDAFTSLLRHAACLVGNSSLALHEAPYIGLPAINVGERQKGRLAGSNVQFVDVCRESLEAALDQALHDQRYREAVKAGPSPYGDGHMAERAVEILKSLPGKRELLAKELTF